MNPEEQVARLEALLARVTTRRSAPRAPAADAPLRDEGVVPAAPVRVEAPTTPPPPVAPPTPTPAPAVAAAPPGLIPPNPMSKATVRVSERVSERPPAVEADVEVEEGMAEVDLDGLDDSASLSDSVADLDAAVGLGEDEELPASSRRPIQIQAQLERLDAATEDKAPHPPPPESGRQVATPSDFEADLLKSGVRAMPEELAPPTPPVAEAADITPEVTRPEVAAASPAVFRGSAPEARPQTFGELLDATLAL